MKVSVQVAREEIRRLIGAGAKFTWQKNSLHGSWLSFTIPAVYEDRVQDILDAISDNWAYEVDASNTTARYELYDFTPEVTVEKKTVFTFKPFMTKRRNAPLPMRTMQGEILRETGKAYQVRLTGLLKPSTTCLHCNRKLTHPVSVLYGLGPVCGGHFHINPCNTEEELQSRYNDMATAMANVTWEGWVPKSQIAQMTRQS